MQAGRWITMVLGVFLLTAGVAVGSSYALDLFGIFRDPAGRQLSVQYNERTAKFFLNQRYVPTNFDGLFIGGSSTSNLPMAELDFAHFYNESIYGANFAEEKRLVDEALRTGHFRYAICAISPFLMSSHDIQEGSGRLPRWEALGSVNIFREELFMAARRLQRRKSTFFPDGGQAMLLPNHFVDNARRVKHIDPVSRQILMTMLDELRARGTQIIFVYPPMEQHQFDLQRGELEAFYADTPMRHPGELLIDLNAPEYSSFRSAKENWVGPLHMTDIAAKVIAAELNLEIHRSLPTLTRSSQAR